MINKEKQLQILKKLGPFDIKTATTKTGISITTLKRWTQEGLIRKIGRGLYVHPESLEDPAVEDFCAACAHFGKKSAVGGLTALFHYGLIEQVPTQIWMIVPPSSKTRLSLYRLIRSKTPFSVGIDDHGSFRITSIERTLVEALKYSTKIGVRTAIAAIRTAIRDRKTTEVKIGRMADKLKMKSVLIKYWETFVE
ncbi:MAG: hypothetical protein HYV97_02775 [Bdellovibrio sp.]|nr:hypothetical protein [Bdellovibrio sp.]